MKYDWTKITTIGARYTNASLVCYAHSRGVRVVKPGTLMSRIEILTDVTQGPLLLAFLIDIRIRIKVLISILHVVIKTVSTIFFHFIVITEQALYNVML